VTAPAPALTLPAGVRIGHWSDYAGWTGCTVILPPAGTIAAGEVRGGGPGTRESDLLSPAANAPGVTAVLFTGGSAFGLAAADGVVQWLAERGEGYPTRLGPVPLVSAAVVYDLGLGDAGARPDAAAGYAACQAAHSAAAGEVIRGSIGAGTGCTVGKLLFDRTWTKGGFGAASVTVGGATVAAVAVVNAIGDVLDRDGSVLAGAWWEGRYAHTTQLVLSGVAAPDITGREATTLVCLMTDARLDKRDAWLAARAGTSGVARAVSPSALPFDGDMVVCLATGAVETDPLVVTMLAAEVAADAIRDAVRQCTGAPGCPAATER
jgi:L-aminopeptidase/D-esterase-like protein